MKIDGKCFCGHVTYDAEVDADRVAVCHCTDCQNHSGSAFGVVVRVVNDSFELKSGKLKTFHKIADSGTKRALAFCPECGTRIYAKTVGEGLDFFGLRVGTITQRDLLPPKIQVWCRSTLSWVEDLSGLPKAEKQPTLEDLAALSSPSR